MYIAQIDGRAGSDQRSRRRHSHCKPVAVLQSLPQSLALPLPRSATKQPPEEDGAGGGANARAHGQGAAAPNRISAIESSRARLSSLSRPLLPLSRCSLFASSLPRPPSSAPFLSSPLHSLSHAWPRPCGAGSSSSPVHVSNTDCPGPRAIALITSAPELPSPCVKHGLSWSSQWP